jgi:predicted NBD/HSP70 family sugar kinase
LVDHAAICLAAVQRDDVARRVIDKAAEYIAECAVTIANALDVELLVLGGKGVTHVADIYKDKVTEFLRSRPLARKTHTVRVAISEMGGDGAALGAAALVLHANYAPNTAHLVNVQA